MSVMSALKISRVVTEPGSSDSAMRMRPYLAAGVAVVGAGLIAVNPVAPIIAADISEPAVRLTGAAAASIGEFTINIAAALPGALDMGDASTAAASIPPAVNPIVEWLNVFSGAFTNVDEIATQWLADPFPILLQMFSNQIGFANDAGSNLQTLAADIDTVLTRQLPANFETLFAGIQAGDASQSVYTFSQALLADLAPLQTPLSNLANIPGEMLTNLGNAVDQIPDILVSMLGDVFTAILAGAQGAVYGLQLALDAAIVGQFDTALVDLLNVPAMTVGGFLNGVTVPSDVPGLLTWSDAPGNTSGLLNDLVNVWPRVYVVPALSGGDTAATLSGDLNQLGNLIFGNLSAALGLDPAAFDPAAFSAAFDPAALSMSFDPAAVTDIGSVLAADLAPNLSTIALDLLSLF
ncbi:hypothetical protein ACOJVU_16520 [Mycobacterium sp. THU-M104]|uniref:hypothetical protein n=1 Tax=Mycobacterium sp. THU-M104 TaxID=3410515 RepID=UPI003B9B65BD